MHNFSQHENTDRSPKTYSIFSVADDAIIIGVGAHLDFRNAADFKLMLTDQLGQGTRTFILDFSETMTCDSTGIGSIFTLHRRLAGLSGVVCFAAASGAVANTVRLTQSHKVFPQFPTVEAARKEAFV